MKSADHNANVEISSRHNVGLVSAGRLIAGISRLNRSITHAEYRFEVTDAVDLSTADSAFCLCDLLHLIKLVQLITSEIANDGCAIAKDQAWLRRVAAHLDQLLTEISTSAAPSSATRFAESERDSWGPTNA